MRMKRSGIVGLAALLALFVVVGVSAQMPDLPKVDRTDSPTKDSTGGRFTSDADNFIGTRDYLGVSMEKWFAAASFSNAVYMANQPPTRDANKTYTDFGFAVKVGELYLAANYRGNLYSGAFPTSKIEVKDIDDGTKWDVYTAVPKRRDAPTTLNVAGVLLGVNNMGFRLAVYSDHDSFSASDFATPQTPASYYKEYDWGKGFVSPQIQWAMATALLPAGVKPQVTVDLHFYSDYLKHDDYSDSAKTGGAKGMEVEYSRNAFVPKFKVGLGGYNLIVKDNGFVAGADFEYTGAFYLYDNEYSVLENNKNVVKTIKGVNDGSNLNEMSRMDNKLSPSLSASWKNDRINLKGKMSLDFDINSSTTTKVNNELKKDGADTSVGTFIFTPALALGAQYQVIPTKLLLNLGAKISFPTLTSKSTTSTTYDAGESKKDETTTTTTYGTVANELSAGITWYMTPNMWLEANTGVKSANNIETPNGGTISLFGDVLNFSGMLFGLKF